MKKLFVTVVAMIAFGSFSNAQINLAAGAGSITGVSQSFNETRGVAINVLSTSNIVIQSVTLHGFFSGLLGADTAYVGVRIYDNTTFALLASSPYDTVNNIAGGTVTIPFSYTLISGNTYMVSVFCGGPNPPTHNSAYLFLPTLFPYIENTNNLEIVHAAAYPADTFPANINYGVPLVTLNTVTTGITEPISPEGITIYPSPGNGVFTVTQSNTNKTDIKIYNIAGKLIYKANTTNQQTKIDLSKQPTGIYFVNVNVGDRQYCRKLIVE